MRRGKKFEAALATVDRAKSYPASDALNTIKSGAFAKFDESVHQTSK